MYSAWQHIFTWLAYIHMDYISVLFCVKTTVIGDVIFPIWRIGYEQNTEMCALGQYQTKKVAFTK